MFGAKKQHEGDLAETFLSRGVERVYPSADFVRARIASGEKLAMYLGVDPTGPTLHLGHAIPLRKLGEFQKLGGKAVLLIGDFTAMIGDPTDKSAARVRLSREEVLANAKLYKQQAEKFLDFGGDNPAEIRYNSEWLGKMSFVDVVELSSHFTVQQMIERDMFEKRIAEGKPVYMHEFLYPLMQGYDSVALDTDGEIGGNDQTFNMLSGRTLLKQMKNKEKFVIATKLLADDSGKKMGKTEGNMLSMSDSASEMYGKVMSWTDGMILPAFELCTGVSLPEIAAMKKELERGANPKSFKMHLAREIAGFYHGEAEAKKAEESFGAAFEKGGIPDDAPEASVAAGTALIDVLLNAKIVESKSEFRRLIEEGAISEIDGEKISDSKYAVTRPASIKVGKRRFLKITIK